MDRSFALQQNSTKPYTANTLTMFVSTAAPAMSLARLAKAAIAGLKKSDEGESGWLMKLKGLEERLPISRRLWAGIKNPGS
ncbi:MAG: hypothetical protein Q7T25_07715 [Sideroxyarcus sp.]|nr:hypothetical protein [Sideroxyarcus sp.]